MINITGSHEVKIKSVVLKMSISHEFITAKGLSVKLELNGKSCQVVFGDLRGFQSYNPPRVSPVTRNAPASCEDLQLTTTSQIGVSKSSNQLSSCINCPLFKLTLRASF